MTEYVNTKNVGTLVAYGMRCSDHPGYGQTNTKVTIPKNANYHLNLVDQCLVTNPKLQGRGPNVDKWVKTGGPFERYTNDVPMYKCLEKKHEDNRAVMGRVMKILVVNSRSPNLATMDPKQLELGAGYKNKTDDIDLIRCTVGNLSLLKKEHPSEAFFSYTDGGIATLRTPEEFHAKCDEMFASYTDHDLLQKALMGDTPMTEFASGDTLALAAQVRVYITRNISPR